MCVGGDGKHTQAGSKIRKRRQKGGGKAAEASLRPLQVSVLDKRQPHTLAHTCHDDAARQLGGWQHTRLAVQGLLAVKQQQPARL